jgi:hypothetical protein
MELWSDPHFDMKRRCLMETHAFRHLLLSRISVRFKKAVHFANRWCKTMICILEKNINVFCPISPFHLLFFSSLPSFLPPPYIIFSFFFNPLLSLSVSRVAQSVWLRARRPDYRGSIPGSGERIFSLASVSRPALGRPVQWVPGVLFPGLKRGWSMTLITHTHLVPRSRMSRSYTFPPPQASPWRVVGQL